MFLTIITINRNNAAGLEKTMLSVLCQTRTDYEYIVVDGASTDGSVAVIKRLAPAFGDRLMWISEPDKGIYNAMNKGIGRARGEYLLFLNSGDSLVTPDVLERVSKAVEKEGMPPILYGNIIKLFPDGRKQRTSFINGKEITLKVFYSLSLPHPSSFIRRSLFDKYGLYDESLKIVSDWKWFLQAVVLGEERVIYSNIDVSFFDMTGISSANRSLRQQEGQLVLDSLIPPRILADYRDWFFDVELLKRIKRYPWAYKLVWFLERCLFKWEKWRKPKK